MELTGLTKALGPLFIERRQKLPDQRLYRKEAKEREHKIADTMLEWIRHEEGLARLRNLETFVATLAAEAEEPLTPDLRENLRELAEQCAALLDKAIATTGVYVRALGDLDHASGQLLKMVTGYDDYLAERLLWVRSVPPIGPATWEVLPTAIAWFFSPTNWLQVLQVLVHAAAGSPLV